MSKYVPTVEERKAARKVVQYYLKEARKQLDDVDQERPSEWIQGLFHVDDLLKEDPDKVFAAYRKEYEAGR